MQKKLESRKQGADQDAEIISQHIAQHADQHHRADQLVPALGDGHRRGGGRAADVGVGG